MTSVNAHTEARTLRAAVAGNPNSGKTSLFNAMTGSNHHVGNYPGVTVERREGRLRHEGADMILVDLPGTYSLAAHSADEIVARDVILHERPDVVINVVDASNLERNLYLTTQLMEMEVPLVIALNMVDVAERLGLSIDINRMSRLLGVPVVATVGNRRKGIGTLVEACRAAAEHHDGPKMRRVTYGHGVDEEVDALAAVVADSPELAARFAPRWVAVKLIEKDEPIIETMRRTAANAQAIENAAGRAIAAIEEHFNEPSEVVIAEARYGYAYGVVRECVTRRNVARRSGTDRIDAVVCHRAAGPLILAGVIYTLFLTVFKIADEWHWVFGRSPSEWVDFLFAWLAQSSAGLEAHSPMLYSLWRDGVIGGLGGIMSFVPLIFIMFAFVAALEDTGYMARVAFVLDRALKVFGLQGKSILAMIISGGLGGGGCAVPGVMATRVLSDPKDRLVTMLVAPLMNCGAKMPVYLMLIAAFFPHVRARVLFVLWLLSWGFALCAAWVIRRFVVRGEQSPFVMELPLYHVPTLRGVLRHTWGRTWMFVKKAGTLILTTSVLLWTAMYFPRLEATAGTPRSAERQAAQLRHSLAGRFGSALEPASRLAGFDWRDNIALIGGFAAKEVVVGTLGVAYAMGDVDPRDAEPLARRLAQSPGWSPLKAFAMMLFVMLYAPCVTVQVTTRRESGHWKWSLFSVTYTTVLALVVAVVVYQLGLAAGVGV